MVQLIIAAVVVVAAVGIGLALRRRQRIDSPTQVSHHVPTQLDRQDFPEPGTPWLVAVFSSATCATCADVVRKAQVLRSSEVAVSDVEYTANRDLHDRYSIGAVPIVVGGHSEAAARRAGRLGDGFFPSIGAQVDTTIIDFGSNSVSLEELKLTVADLDRLGPSLVLDQANEGGDRVLVWSQ